MTNQEKTRLQQFIRDGKLQQAIDTFLSIETDKDKKQEALAIANRYKRLQEQRIQEVISFEQAKITENQIILSFLHLIDGSKAKRSFTGKTTIPLRNQAIWKYLLAAILLLIILAEISGLINLIPSGSSPTPLQLTVYITDRNGNVVLENTGELNFSLGNRGFNRLIGSDGRTNFGEIPAKFKDSLVTIGFKAEGWELVNPQNTFRFTGNPIHLKVRRDNSLGIIKGVVKSRDGQAFIEEALVRINNDTTILTDAQGTFNIILPEAMRVEKAAISYQLTVSKEGYKTTTQPHYPKSSDAEIRLEKQ